jgi:methionyl-tRNA formyltransferase
LKVLFAGTPEFAARHLSALLTSEHRIVAVITRPDKPGKRGRTPVAGPVKRLAVQQGLTVLQPRRLARSDIEPLTPDVMVVVAYGQLVKPDVLDVPRYGCINVHASLLPRWRGAAPVQRAILAGDHRTGICTMQMDEGLDTGDVLVTREVAIAGDDTAGSLTEKLAPAGCDALLETLTRLESGELERHPQPETGVTWANKIEKGEAHIDWDRSAPDIALAVRAFNPDPVAYTFLDELRVKVYEASARERREDAEAGEIISMSSEGIEVACAEGSLLLTRVQLPVGKGAIVTGRDLVNARRQEFSKGKRFN